MKQAYALLAALILLALSLFVQACGGSDQSPLERRFGINGKSACDEVNKTFSLALKNHLTKTPQDAQAMYTLSLMDTLDFFQENAVRLSEGTEEARKNILDEYYSIRRSLFSESQENANLAHLETCEDLIRIDEFRTSHNLIAFMQGMPLGPHQVMQEFLSFFADRLDYFSEYLPSTSSSSSLGNFGVRIDTLAHETYQLETPFIEVFEVASAQSSLKAHDRIISMSAAYAQSPSEMISIEYLLKDKTRGLGFIEAQFYRPQGKFIDLLVTRDGKELKFTLEAKSEFARRLPSVHVERLNTCTLYARIYSFAVQTSSDREGVAEELSRKLQGLRTQVLTERSLDYDHGGKSFDCPPVRVVLDLRLNPGGSLDEMVKVASSFLGPGQMATLEEKHETNPIEATTASSNEFESFLSEPLVILVNHRSASAADILPSILKGLHRAYVIGEPTFGKFIGQGFIDLTQIGGTFKLTSLRIFSSDGVNHQISGINPDKIVKDPRVEKFKADCKSTEKKCGVFSMKDLETQHPGSVIPASSETKPLKAPPKNWRIQPFNEDISDTSAAEDPVLAAGLEILKRIQMKKPE